MNVTTLRPYYPTCSCFEKTKDLLLSMVKSRPICGQLWWESSEAESFLVLKTIWALTRSLTLISLVKSRSICSAVVSFLVLKTIHVAQCWQGAISFADNLLNLCLKWRKAPTLKSHTELNTQQLSIIYSNQCESHTVSQIRTCAWSQVLIIPTAYPRQQTKKTTENCLVRWITSHHLNPYS